MSTIDLYHSGMFIHSNNRGHNFTTTT